MSLPSAVCRRPQLLLQSLLLYQRDVAVPHRQVLPTVGGMAAQTLMTFPAAGLLEPWHLRRAHDVYVLHLGQRERDTQASESQTDVC